MSEHSDRYSLLDWAIRKAPLGHVLEFGVSSGETLRFIATRVDTVHGFDSFEGLPEDWRPGFARGTFRTVLPNVPVNVWIHIGLFGESLPLWLEQYTGPVGFVHIDCDLYSSTATVLRLVGPRLAPGAVLVFDELHGYPGYDEHEFKALAEWLASTGKQVEPIGYVPGDQQVALRVL